MSDRNAAAIYIGDCMKLMFLAFVAIGKIQYANQRHCRKGLIDLDDVDII
jgi:hypothetical protein